MKECKKMAKRVTDHGKIERKSGRLRSDENRYQREGKKREEDAR